MRRYRPALHVPRSPLESLLELATVIGVIGTIALTIWGWMILPSTIPTHYNIVGQPDAYGGKGMLLIAPLLAILVSLLLAVVSRYPHIYNYPIAITDENAPRQYRLARTLLKWISLEIAWMSFYLQWSLIQAAQNHSGQGLLLVLAFPAAILATVILYIIKMSRAR